MSVDTSAPYDDSNLFAKLLRGEIPCQKIYEDDFALAFNDIHPQAPVHVLVIPRGRYVSMIDFTAKAPPELIAGFWRAVGATAQALGLETTGYRVISNTGRDAVQQVPHIHVHVLAGQFLGPLVSHEL
jgi:histidine triad (HIT) family protein